MSSAATYAASMPGKRFGKLRSDSVFFQNTLNETQSTEVTAPSSLFCLPFFPQLPLISKDMLIFPSVGVKEAMPGLHYNSNIAEPIKATSPMLHWAFGRHFSVLFLSQTLQDNLWDSNWVSKLSKREQNQGFRPKCSEINKSHSPNKRNGHAAQQGVANRQREKKWREWGNEVEKDNMRRWLSRIAVAEEESELLTKGSGKWSRRRTNPNPERAQVCFPVQEQYDRGAQAVDGHSPNSIILLVAKFKTGKLDCECYIKDCIFILSLWGRKFAYKSVYRSVCKKQKIFKTGT